MVKEFLTQLKEKGWKQRGIAEKTGLGESYISELCNGSSCSIKTVIQIADAFNVTTDEVLSRTPARPRTLTEELLLKVTEGDDEITRAALRSAQGEKLLKQAGGEGAGKQKGKAA